MAIKIAGKQKTAYSEHLSQDVKASAVVGKVSIQPLKMGQPLNEPSETDVLVHTNVVGNVKVGCSGNRTVNLGNYESIKIGVWLEMPCSKDSISETFEYVSDWVGERLSEAVKLSKGG